MVDSERLRKFSAFSIDTILAREGGRSRGRVMEDHVAVTDEGDDGGYGSSDWTSVDNAWSLFNDVARRFLIARSSADTRRLIYREEEPDTDAEQFTDNISKLIDSNGIRSHSSSNFVGSWLQRCHCSIQDCETPRFDSRSSASYDPPSRHYVDGLPAHHHALVELSGTNNQQGRRQAELYMVDGHHPVQSPPYNDIDVVGCNFDEESTSEADGGNGASWSAKSHHNLQGDSREANHAPGRLHADQFNLDTVLENLSAARNDTTLLWPVTRPFTGK